MNYGRPAHVGTGAPAHPAPHAAPSSHQPRHPTPRCRLSHEMASSQRSAAAQRPRLRQQRDPAQDAAPGPEAKWPPSAPQFLIHYTIQNSRCTHVSVYRTFAVLLTRTSIKASSSEDHHVCFLWKTNGPEKMSRKLLTNVFLGSLVSW